MLLRHDPEPPPPPEPLEPGEQPAAPPWRVALWGASQPMTSGLLTVTDRYLRFTSTWALLEAALPSASKPPPLRVPRADVLGVRRERVALLLRALRLSLRGGREVKLVGSGEVLDQIERALGGRKRGAPGTWRSGCCCR